MSEWGDKRFEPKTRCKAKVLAEYRQNEQCLFPHWKDGYCRRHHPETHLATLRRQLHRHQKSATELLIKIGALENKGAAH
jgi:hypothetical protein